MQRTVSLPQSSDRDVFAAWTPDLNTLLPVLQHDKTIGCILCIHRKNVPVHGRGVLVLCTVDRCMRVVALRDLRARIAQNNTQFWLWNTTNHNYDETERLPCSWILVCKVYFAQTCRFFRCSFCATQTRPVLQVCCYVWG